VWESQHIHGRADHRNQVSGSRLCCSRSQRHCRGTAHTATQVLQSQAPYSLHMTSSAQAFSQDTPGGAAILDPQEQQQPLQTK